MCGCDGTAECEDLPDTDSSLREALPPLSRALSTNTFILDPAKLQLAQIDAKESGTVWKASMQALRNRHTLIYRSTQVRKKGLKKGDGQHTRMQARGGYVGGVLRRLRRGHVAPVEAQHAGPAHAPDGPAGAAPLQRLRWRRLRRIPILPCPKNNRRCTILMEDTLRNCCTRRNSNPWPNWPKTASTPSRLGEACIEVLTGYFLM